MDYLAGPGMCSLIVCVQDHHLDSRGWRPGRGSFRRVNPSNLAALRDACTRATGAAEWNDDIERASTNEILKSLELALGPWFASGEPPLPRKDGAFHFEVVEDVEKFWIQSGSAKVPSIQDILDRVAVPERTLFHAFRQSVRMGPIRYLKLLRLHNLRDRLLQADPKRDTVTEIAHAMGFEQLGRLAGYYKRQFVETPLQTLNRQAPE